MLELLNAQEQKLGRQPTRYVVNGSEAFGFGLPEVAVYIEGMEGADLCKNYVFRKLRRVKFTVGEESQAVKRNSEENGENEKRAKEQCF